MKSGPVLVATLFAITSFPALAQQSPSDPSPGSPVPQNSTPATQPEQPAPPDTAAPSAMPQTTPDNQSAPQSQPDNPAATPQSPAAEAAPAVAPAASMSPVHAELVGNLDTKTAKTGDNVVAETKGSVKTSDGTEIPKGTKLVGHVIAVQPSAPGQNSQVALAFDHAELKGGASLPIQSQIQSIEPPEGSASASAPDAMSRNNSMGAPAGAGASSNGTPGSAGGSSSTPAYSPVPPSSSAQAQGAPAAGTVVAQTGKIDIRATSIPGVLLANNAPGEQDPRMAQASSILLGAKQDVKLEGGTRLVIGVAAAPGPSPAAAQP